MKLNRPKIIAGLLFLSLVHVSTSFAQGGLHLAQGTLAGEVTSTSAILQTRLTSVTSLTAGDVPGAAGTGRFEIWTEADFRGARHNAWLDATDVGDFILKAQRIRRR